MSKEDMEERIEQEFATLNANLELEQSMKKEVCKQHVGRSKKQIEAILLPIKVEKVDSTQNTIKVRGPYKNWFIPFLWDPIYAAMNHHRCFRSALRYLQLKYKLPRQKKSVYDDLNISSMKI